MAKKEKTENKTTKQSVKKDNKTIVKVKKLDSNAVIPFYNEEGDMFLALKAISVRYNSLEDTYVYRTGLAFETEQNVGQFIFLPKKSKDTEAYLTNHVDVNTSLKNHDELVLYFKNRMTMDSILKENSIGSFMDTLKENLSDENIDAKAIKEILLAGIEAYNLSTDKKTVPPRVVAQAAMRRAPFNIGDVIGYLVFLRYPNVEIKEVEEFEE